jgi:hypothetical protein
MSKLYVPKGDKGFNLAFTIRDSSGNAYDITLYTITFKLWRKGIPGTLILSGACVIDSGVAGTCHYVVTDSSFTSVGEFKAELELTKTGVLESTQSFDFEVTESA